ncbi:hypothetical protein BCR22_03300 [Enterococcus plantarum]|uniref:hypothetical protein n=1 Tax=Enterococcus plantarum TaxID=1077675 RepID=UPI00084CFE82|nr:hypothetical protein [Enterococcus plantarum]OEG13283.1 hypothetical protein BCR22_03300 [Enterococcus plantarum]
MKFPYNPLEVSSFEVDDIEMAYIFYKEGGTVNRMYPPEESRKHVVGFKWSDKIEMPNSFTFKEEHGTILMLSII